ncbi:hypothetical protein [Streptomyces sp. MBT62]|uniref:hypothetical protein n=1 Tax=Streptomyces sp. MBT62 TaxID=2800410 RepID=UPI00190CD690|nr:hypothetical protein [Streptomyces sp. MBT62]MBK3564490.1 hypothetical protein [Streptomyces sp. MBT62]
MAARSRSRIRSCSRGEPVDAERPVAGHRGGREVNRVPAVLSVRLWDGLRAAEAAR